ncbi:MAG: acetyl-CoA carboxylase biotin carboxyl carrier protein [Acidimicrobiia bacterium]
MSDEHHDQLALDSEALHALCDEANGLIKRLAGPVHKVSIRAGDYRVDVEWDLSRAAAAPAPATGASVAPADGDSADSAVDERPAVLALLVGTFYRAPEPGAPPFVEVGDIVEANQDVAIIEAMKMMNRVQTDRAGRVAEILVENGEMVEFEQRLIVIEPVEEAEG